MIHAGPNCEILNLLNQGVFTLKTIDIMARPIESQLYQELVGSCFNFIERGTREIYEIYESVQNRFPALCDDGYPCLHQKQNGKHQAEWKHIVRSALGRCKIKSDSVYYTGNRGFWLFS